MVSNVCRLGRLGLSSVTSKMTDVLSKPIARAVSRGGEREEGWRELRGQREGRRKKRRKQEGGGRKGKVVNGGTYVGHTMDTHGPSP